MTIFAASTMLIIYEYLDCGSSITEEAFDYFEDILMMGVAHFVCLSLQIVNSWLPDVRPRSNIIYLKTAFEALNTLIYIVCVLNCMFNRMALKKANIKPYLVKLKNRTDLYKCITNTTNNSTNEFARKVSI